MTAPIAAVVVLYRPDESVVDNIYRYIDCLSHLVVVDNSEKPNVPILERLASDLRVSIIANFENRGIASAINLGIEKITAHNYEWVLLMDQDSYFDRQMLEKYMYCFHQLPLKEKIGITGPDYSQENSNENTRDVISLITSGSYMNVPLFNLLGGYNENLFIDEVDHEYCYRVILAGYKVLQFPNIYLNHSLGQKGVVKTFSGVKKTKTFHTPLRLYYIVRNSLYVISKYRKFFPDEMKLKRKSLHVRVKNNLLYGTNKLSSLKYVILGFLHFKKNRLGKF